MVDKSNPARTPQQRREFDVRLSLEPRKSGVFSRFSEADQVGQVRRAAPGGAMGSERGWTAGLERGYARETAMGRKIRGVRAMVGARELAAREQVYNMLWSERP